MSQGGLVKWCHVGLWALGTHVEEPHVVTKRKGAEP